MSSRKGKSAKNIAKPSTNDIKKESFTCIRRFPLRISESQLQIPSSSSARELSELIRWVRSLTPKELACILTLPVESSDRLSNSLDLLLFHLVTTRKSRREICWLYEANHKEMKVITGGISCQCCTSCAVFEDYMINYRQHQRRYEQQFLELIEISADMIKPTRIIRLPSRMASIDILIKALGDAQIRRFLLLSAASRRSSSSFDQEESTKDANPIRIDNQIFSLASYIGICFLDKIVQDYRRHVHRGYTLGKDILQSLPPHRSLMAGLRQGAPHQIDRKIIFESFVGSVRSCIQHPNEVMKSILETSYRRDTDELSSKQELSIIRSNPRILSLWLLNYLISTLSARSCSRSIDQAAAFEFGDLEETAFGLCFYPILDAFTPVHDWKAFFLKQAVSAGNDKIAQELIREEEEDNRRVAALSLAAVEAILRKQSQRKKKKERKRRRNKNAQQPYPKLLDSQTGLVHQSTSRSSDDDDDEIEAEMAVVVLESQMIERSMEIIYEVNEDEDEESSSDDDPNKLKAVDPSSVLQASAVVLPIPTVGSPQDKIEPKMGSEMPIAQPDQEDQQRRQQPMVSENQSFDILNEAVNSEMRTTSVHFIPWQDVQSQSSPITGYVNYHPSIYPQAHAHPQDDYNIELFPNNTHHHHGFAMNEYAAAAEDLPWYIPPGAAFPALPLPLPLPAHHHLNNSPDGTTYFNLLLSENNYNIQEFDESFLSAVYVDVDEENEKYLAENHCNKLKLHNEGSSSVDRESPETEDDHQAGQVAEKDLLLSPRRSPSSLELSTDKSISQSSTPVSDLYARIMQLEAMNLRSETSRSVLINKVALSDCLIRDISSSQKIQQQHEATYAASSGHRPHLYPMHPTFQTPIKHYHDDNIRSYASQIDVSSSTFMSSQQQQQQQQHPMPVFSTPSSMPSMPLYVTSDAMSEDGDRQENLSRARNASVGQMDLRTYSSAGKQLSVRALLPLKPLGTHSTNTASAQIDVSLSSSAAISPAPITGNMYSTAANVPSQPTSSTSQVIEEELVDENEATLLEGVEDILSHRTSRAHTPSIVTQPQPALPEPRSRPTSAKEHYGSAAYYEAKHLQSGLSHDILRFVQLLDTRELSLRR
jgi:hypothetical protein